MKPLLEIKNLNINYKNSIKAVKNVNFTLEDNQIISIVFIGSIVELGS